MRFVDVALPVLAGAAAVTASGLNFNAIIKADPTLKSIKPTHTKTPDKGATARSIINSLRSSHKSVVSAASVASAAAHPTHTLVTTTKKPAVTTKPASTKATSTKAAAKPATSTKSTAKAEASSKAPEKSAKQKRAVVSAAGTTTVNTQCASAAAQSYQYSGYSNSGTALSWATDYTFGNVSLAALAPAGYTRQAVGLSGSIFDDPVYLGYKELSSYDVNACAAFCNSFSGCAAFNIYFERNPSLATGPSCLNPAAATVAKCALWRSQVTAAQAVNVGEFRSNFVVVVTASNIYWRNNAPAGIPGFTGPSALPGFISDGTYLTNNGFYPGSYDPTQCSSLCVATGNASCQYFDAAWISIYGQTYGTYCGIYSSNASVPTANIYYDVLGGVQYDVTYSYGYQVAASAGFYLQISGATGTSNGQFLKANGTSLTLTTTKTTADIFKINNANSYLFDTTANSNQYIISSIKNSTSSVPAFATDATFSATTGYQVAAAWNTATNAVTFKANSAAYNFQLCGSTLTPSFSFSATATGCQTVSLLAVAA